MNTAKFGYLALLTVDQTNELGLMTGDFTRARHSLYSFSKDEPNG